MTNVDKILIKIINHANNDLESIIPRRDARVLRSLLTAISSSEFITENQSKLLVKILKEHLSKFENVVEELLESLTQPSWSRIFREIDKTKKFYISSTENRLFIEFTFSSAIRKALNKISNQVDGMEQTASGKFFSADLTEQNIVLLYNLLESLEFDIDQKICDFYQIITTWDESSVRSQFLITNFTHANFQKQITADLGINTAIDQNIINDRSVRYQYFTEKTEKNPKNLTEILSQRSGPRVWVDQTKWNLDQIVESLVALKRFPVLVVFEQNNPKKCMEDLTKLHESLEKNRIFDNIGIYFRLTNDSIGTQFNKFIADHRYNYHLDNTTNVVVVQNGKIPKFFIKNEWKPMSVISIGNTLRHTKTSVYANACDLVISLTDAQPIIESRVV